MVFRLPHVQVNVQRLQLTLEESTSSFNLWNHWFKVSTGFTGGRYIFADVILMDYSKDVELCLSEGTFPSVSIFSFPFEFLIIWTRTKNYH